MWNQRVPERYPQIIVQANDADDVVAAVRRAAKEGLRLTCCSGGHSWAGNHLRDGCLLLDLSRLDSFTISKSDQRAIAGPGCSGAELTLAAMRENLFFPGGHCKGVCIGGYLLQGGFGWHGRTLGMACESVLALDIVTVEGELVHASPDENADLYWAARGAGPGFFGVVTRFHLRLHPKPRFMGVVFFSVGMDHLDDTFRWAHSIGPEVPASVEFQLLMSRRASGVFGPGIEVFAPVFADSYREARRDVAFMGSSPVRRHASFRVPLLPVSLRLMYRLSMQRAPANHRWAVDNMWTHAGVDDLLPGLHALAESLPPPPSHMLWLNWAPPPERESMAFSLEDQIYIAAYAGWKDAADDGDHANWPVDNMRAMEGLASGCQLADENLGARPARFVSDANLARLDEIRAARDPERRFHPWMGRP
jgi:FAD/FMN-containing dehydrogenase